VIFGSLLVAALASAIAPASAQSAGAQTAAPDYSKDQNWLCLPGRTDSCSAPLETTALGVNGYGSVERSKVAEDPPLDCFYVYPTVSGDGALNSDMNAGREQRLAAETQFARFASVCRPFAPLYRQMTFAAVAAYSAGANVDGAAAIAYADVRAAWRNYIRTRNKGRPFILIGHSQGSLMLEQLLAQEIETSPGLASRMKLAILPGFNVLVPQGKLVGGTFKKTPLCSRPGETGCVVSWTSFRENNVLPEGAMFGYSDQPGMTVGCVNPAALGSREWVKLDSYWFTRSTLPVPGGPIRWSSEGQPSTPYVRTQGLVSARCVNDGQRGFLSIRTNHFAGEKWTDHIGGEVSVLGMFLPGWGMHLADLAEAQGDLVRQVGEISARSRTAAQPKR
jgi:hypothetical protein